MSESVDGTLGDCVEYSKARKARVLKALYKPTCQDFMVDILQGVLRFVQQEIAANWISRRNIAPIPKHLEKA